jgi:hypothetical protein
MNARVAVVFLDDPTTVDPFEETAKASLVVSPGKKPSPSIPLPEVQMKPWFRTVGEDPALPTIVEPSAETAVAWLLAPPGRKPSPTIPVEEVQRNAWNPEELSLPPTTIELSAEIPVAALPRPVLPGNQPSSVNPSVPVKKRTASVEN